MKLEKAKLMKEAKEQEKIEESRKKQSKVTPKEDDYI